MNSPPEADGPPKLPPSAEVGVSASANSSLNAGPATKTKAKGGGCLKALGIAAAVLFVVGVVGGILIYRYVQTPEGHRVFKLATGVTKMAAGSLRAPGTEELRKLGCAQAIVMTGEDIETLAMEIADAGPIPKRGGHAPIMVRCSLGFTDKAIGCDEVAATYRAAVPPAPGTIPRRLNVAVQRAASTKPICEGEYGYDAGVVDEDGFETDDEFDDEPPAH